MEKLWFYKKSGSPDQQGPVGETELKNLISRGAIASQDTLWAEGMSDWKPLSALPELHTKTGAPALPQPSVVGTRLPEGLLGWLGFVAIMNIISGVFLALSCIGILNGVLTIIAGTALLAAKSALAGVGSIDASLSPFFEKLKTFAQMTGVVFIIGLVGGLIGIILWFTIFAATFASAMSSM